MEIKNPELIQQTKDDNDKEVVGVVLRRITGWALLAAAIGTFYDSYASWGTSEGSIGLIPLYIGFPIGSIGLILITRKVAGWVPTVLITIGLAGILYFMFAYPNGVNGWIGGILIGIAHPFFPLPGRFASVLWVAVGILGFPEFGARSWGIIAPFTLFGAATAASGAFVLWGLDSVNPEYVSEQS